MTMYLRRAITLRSSMQLLRSSTIQSRNVSHIISNQNLEACNTQKAAASPAFGFLRDSFLEACNTQKAAASPGFDFLRDSRRGFAKGKTSKDDSGTGRRKLGVFLGERKPEFFLDKRSVAKCLCVVSMEEARVALWREFKNLRTGRASPEMLHHIIVEFEDTKNKFYHLANVSVIDSKTLSIDPFDPEKIKAIEKAIVSSSLGLNPKVDGDRLIAAIQPFTKEDVQATRKELSKCCKDAKQILRRARRKVLDKMKKAMSEKDTAELVRKEIDERFKEYVTWVEDKCKAKGKEITQAWAEDRCKAKKKEITKAE
ncbi:hypothetical protein SLE2022_194760 [Rubroshorea leprosula]